MSKPMTLTERIKRLDAYYLDADTATRKIAASKRPSQKMRDEAKRLWKRYRRLMNRDISEACR